MNLIFATKVDGCVLAIRARRYGGIPFYIGRLREIQSSRHFGAAHFITILAFKLNVISLELS